MILVAIYKCDSFICFKVSNGNSVLLNMNTHALSTFSKSSHIMDKWVFGSIAADEYDIAVEYKVQMFTFIK